MSTDWVDVTMIPPAIVGGVLGYWACVAKLHIQRKLDVLTEEVHDMSDFIHKDEPVEVEPPEQHEDGHRTAAGDRPVSNPFRITVIATLVTICALSAVYFAGEASKNLDETNQKLAQVNAAQKVLDEDQADFERQTDCQQELLAQTIDALKSRSTFAEQQAQVNLALSKAQLKFLHTPSTSTDAERIEAFNTYIEALQVNIQAIKEQLQVRIDNPYPSLFKVKSCE